MSSVSVTSESNSTSPEGSSFAGFWRRLLAFIVDILILGVGGMMLGIIFFDFFMQLGAWGRLLGFAIAMLYFGIQDSRLCGGQTLGKRWLKIRVVQEGGRLLGIAPSMLRSMVVCIPYFLNNAMLSEQLLARASVAISVLIFGVGASLIYLYIFNRATRQSLQDLIAGSYVIKTDSQKAPEGLTIWRGHYVAVALLLIFAIALPLFAMRWSHVSPYVEMLGAQRAILDEKDVAGVAINIGSTQFHSVRGTSTSTSYVASIVTLRRKIQDGNSFANSVANIILGKIPSASNKDVVNVHVRYGYDIGIASYWRGTNYAFSPSEWKQRISR